MSIADILGEVMAPPPSRGRKAHPITASVRRELNDADIKALWTLSEGALDASTPPLVQLRHKHHHLARLLGKGVSNAEASLMTGMTPGRISILRGDPAFKELVEYYAQQAEEHFVNVQERLAILGLSTVEELSERLELEPGTFSNRELMELAALGLDRSGHGPQSKVAVASSTVLTVEVIDKLKAEIEARRNGTVRPLALTSHRQEPGLGPVIEHEPVAEAPPTQGREGEGSDI